MTTGVASGSRQARAAFAFGVFAMATNLVTIPAWVPLVLTRVAPGPSQRGLATVRDQIARRGRGFTVGLLSAAGLFFIGRGLIRLLG